MVVLRFSPARAACCRWPLFGFYSLNALPVPDCRALRPATVEVIEIVKAVACRSVVSHTFAEPSSYVFVRSEIAGARSTLLCNVARHSDS